MVASRLGRLEEKRQWKRIILASIGSISVLVFMAVFGLRILEGFSIFIGNLHGATSPANQNQPQSIIFPPILNPPPEATFSGTIDITGSGQAGATLILYVNDKESKKVTIDKDSTFTASDVPLQEGANAISAKIQDTKGKLSDLSDVYTIQIKKTPPKLDVSDPPADTTKSGDDRNLNISGSSEANATITVNDRLVISNKDGSFHYSMSLNDGDNDIRIVATDVAGNKTTVERHVTYNH
jgi:hypothetical protein